MATDPIFAATPQVAVGQVTTAEASRTAPTNVVTVYTSGASGSRIESIEITATGTTTAGMIRIFLYDGSSYRLLIEQPVTAVTPSATVPTFYVPLIFGDLKPLILKNGWSIRCTTEKTETFNITIIGGDF